MLADDVLKAAKTRRRTAFEDLEVTLAMSEHARDQALRKVTELQGKLDLIESHMTLRFSTLAMSQRNPISQAQIDELKLLLRKIQGRN